jgi:NAD(P)-dependent dehydrogenase (short-subunit alcohol dehydrogenase family)
MFTNDTLQGETILITGGGSGLGLHMAKAFGALGAGIVICGRDADRLKRGAAEITATGAAVRTAVCDVRDYDATAKMFLELTKDGSEITGLVNNAAGNFLCAAEDLSANAFKSVVDIVLHGSFNCTQAFGKHRIERKKPGTILNIVTTYTECGSSFVLPSACAKAGVYAMTTSLAYEWADYGIRLNAIAPGPFPTEGAWKRLVPDPQLEETFRKRVPLGRFGKPEELADLAVFLMSKHSSFITGECVTIDGGERLNSGQFNFVLQAMPKAKLKAVFNAMKDKARPS